MEYNRNFTDFIRNSLGKLTKEQFSEYAKELQKCFFTDTGIVYFPNGENNTIMSYVTNGNYWVLKPNVYFESGKLQRKS